jgi:DNA-binding response OmpR family regulator
MERTLTFLAVDDDPGMTELLKNILSTSTTSVVTSNSGFEGLELARSQTFDLIILDLIMDGMDGLHICRNLRQFSSVPILIISALDSPGTVAEALNAGADDFQVKPVSSTMLTARINKMLRRGNTGPLSMNTLPPTP